MKFDRKFDRKSPTGKCVTFKGMKYPLLLDGGLWRMRKRHQKYAINFATGTANLEMARELCLQELEKRELASYKKPCRRTLAELVEFYRDMPKKAGAAAEKQNVTMLGAVVKLTLGKELAAVRVDEVTPKLWRDYMAKRQGGKLDLSTRRKENAAINSAVRCAASMFIPRLRPLYKEEGFIIADDATEIQWLPTIAKIHDEVDEEAMLAAWRGLKPAQEAFDEWLGHNTGKNDLDAWRAIAPSKLAMWFTFALSRFAGLRRKEIMACRGGWVSVWKDQPIIKMQDRPDEGFLSKTGKAYRAHIIDAELFRMLSLVPKEENVVIRPRGGHTWEHNAPQRWLRRFMPASEYKPLHRLRSLYAVQLSEMTEEATAAKLAGIKAAADALGHTSTQTTKASYLPDS